MLQDNLFQSLRVVTENVLSPKREENERGAKR